MPHYLAGQYLGAFLASCTVFLVYWDALVWYEHDRGGYRTTPDTAAIFSTYPAPHLTLGGGILDQVTVTAMLLLCVCAITDTRNMKVGKFFSPKLKRPFAEGPLYLDSNPWLLVVGGTFQITAIWCTYSLIG